jgi:UDP-N-acetylmuramate dehydrogenase
MAKPDFICANKPLFRHSTLGIGGDADFFALIDNLDKLAEAVEFSRDEGLDVFVIGRGSNILFSDQGYRGLVLKIGVRKMHHFMPGKEFWVEAGALVSTIVDLGTKIGFSGFENFAGLPGTVGGAIHGNAGCFGSEFWKRVEAVKFFDGGDFQEFRPSNHPMPYSYRHSIFKDHPNWIIVSARLKIEETDPGQVAQRVKEVAEQRAKRQPGAKNIGCIFKNPLRDSKMVSAGKLIDEAGLKGSRVGNALVSHVHANFFENLGGAKAGDFLELIKIVRSKVYSKFGIMLEEEIVKVGEF